MGAQAFMPSKTVSSKSTSKANSPKNGNSALPSVGGRFSSATNGFFDCIHSLAPKNDSINPSDFIV